MKDYQKHDERIMRFFEYHPFDEYEQRLHDLKEWTFEREKLAKVLHTLNKSWGATEETLHNIERLKDERSVVVIGGQQAGLLSGPLYTINKIISILYFAKKQEEKLQIPVIPVFWIAGEDHDFDEINHIYRMKTHSLDKHQMNQFVQERVPISNIKIDQSLAKQWIDDIFLDMQETAYTKNLYEMVHQCLERSTTFVDFFAHFIHCLFKEEGLVLIDSHHPQVRRIEKEYFRQLIEKQEEISMKIFRATQTVRQAGYPLTINPEPEDAHLFYHFKGERILLSKTSEENWQGKQQGIQLMTEELLEIAREQPERLSNNVVTRPLMQEMLFPTLAFIGGWGEISYWSVLKEAFHVLRLKMPPVVPRLSLSYVEPKVAKLIEKYAMDYEKVISNGVQEERINWLASQPTYPTELVTNQLKRDIKNLHKPLRDIAEKVNPSLKELSKANLDNIYKKIDFLVRTIMREVEGQYENHLIDFTILELHLHPDHQLQERRLNPIFLLNDCGLDFIKSLKKEKLSFQKDHYLIFL